MPRFCHNCGSVLLEAEAFCSTCGTSFAPKGISSAGPVPQSIDRSLLDEANNTAVLATLEAGRQVKFRIGMAVAALGALLLGVVLATATANKSFKTDGSAHGKPSAIPPYESNLSLAPSLEQNTSEQRYTTSLAAIPRNHSAGQLLREDIAQDSGMRLIALTNNETAPVETPEVVTLSDLARFPAIYKGRRIQLVGWSQGLFNLAVGDEGKGDSRLDGCKFEILVGLSGGVVRGGALGCLDDNLKPEQKDNFYRSNTCHLHFVGSVQYAKCRNNALGSRPPLDSSLDSTVWSTVVEEEDVNLVCTVKSSGLASFAGIASLLTHCELSKSSSRAAEEAMEEREEAAEKNQEVVSSDSPSSRGGTLMNGKVWTSLVSGNEWSVRSDGDYLYADWINVPQEAREQGAFIKDELKKGPDGKWRGKTRSRLPCHNGNITNWCKGEGDFEIDLFSERRIEGIAMSWEKLDCGKCEYKGMKHIPFTWIPKE
jgi:hypothetical protein